MALDKSTAMGNEKLHVLDRRVNKSSLELILKGGNKITIRRFAPVGRGDVLIIDEEGYLVELPNSRGRIPLSPVWQKDYKLSSVEAYKIKIKEIETQEELEDYKRLTEFHYRGGGGVGRRVPLIAVTDCWELPKVIGFIELSSSFLVNTARDKILNAPFSDSLTGIGWTKWDSKAVRKFGNSIVRISRCVVFPELRGIGLSSLLVNAAVKYSKDRWHIGGLRPSFIEITAEMLGYCPFVRNSCFCFVGATEGNKHRMVKDMQYLLGRKMKEIGLPQGGGGILSQQRSNATTLAEVMRQRELSLSQVVNFLQISPDKLSDEDWIQLHKVYRRPKPTYLKGLTESAEKFLNRRVGILRKVPSKKSQKDNSQNDIVVKIKNFNISVSCKPISSLRGRRVQEAFGIVSIEFYSKLIDKLELSLRRGEIILIGGASGSGKSLLLRAIRRLAGQGKSRGRLPNTVKADANLESPQVRIAWPQKVPSEKSPIELLTEFTLEESLRLLAAAGLAEAQLFVRPSCTLSAGQSYRLSLALAIAKKPDLLLIDEFCEPLDRFTTIAVCKSLRKSTRNFPMGIIVATANPTKVMDSLCPDHFLLLSTSGHSRWVKK